MIQGIIFKFRKWHTCNYEWYRLYRSYENCRRPGVAILDVQMSKVPIISGYVSPCIICHYTLEHYPDYNVINKFGRLIVFAPFLLLIIIIIIASPRLPFLFHYYSYSYSSTHFCPLDFSEMPWTNFMKPCKNIICHVKLCVKGLIFFKMAAVAMETAKMLKNWKTQNDHSRLLAKQKLMKLDRNNIHI